MTASLLGTPPESSETPNKLTVQCFLNCHCHKDSFRFTSRQGPHPPTLPSQGEVTEPFSIQHGALR